MIKFLVGFGIVLLAFIGVLIVGYVTECIVSLCLKEKKWYKSPIDSAYQLGSYNIGVFITKALIFGLVGIVIVGFSIVVCIGSYCLGSYVLKLK